MGALSRVQELQAVEQEQQSNSRLFELLTSMQSQLQTVLEHQCVIVGTVADLVTAQNSSTQVIERLSTSQAPETSSAARSSEIAQLQSSVSEVGETVKLLSETVIGSTTVRLAGGETVKQSDLSALELSRNTNDRMEAMTSSVDQLAVAVKSKARVSVDADKVAAVVVGQVATASEKRVAALFDAQEQRLAAMGTEQSTQLAVRLQEATAALAKAEARMERLPRALAWRGVGNVALALLPFALVALVFAQLLGMAGGILGVGPVFGWAWESFAAAPEWWQKLLIALATLTVAGTAIWLVLKLGKVVAEHYKGWR